jgi:glycosyltransferase involved in cell wall biosynthesis
MYQTLRRLTSLADVHLVTVLDYVYEQEAHEPLTRLCASAEFILRPEGQPKEFGSIVPHAVREFANADLQWTIHRQMFTKEVDLVQLEYMPMGQYAGDYRRLACALFEHDIYFQSIARQLPSMTLGRKVSATFEYLRALRYELRLLPRLDRIQVCSSANRSVLASFLPRLAVPVDDDLRAGIDVSCYDFKPCGREPDTMLFLGNFRHAPNLEALSWFAGEVLPRVLERRPAARLIVVGADLPPRHFLPRHSGAIEMRGYVDDVRQPLAECAVFVCPILAGSGMRVKLLEAFAAGIPCVSTYIGAEGLADKDGDICALADAPQIFADRTAWLLENPREAAEMARRARASVETRDFAHMTRNLVTSYRDTLATKRSR